MEFPKATWRLIKHPSAAGSWNMAVDAAILHAAGRGDVPPTLRLYAWDPPCLSLGYAQPVLDVDLDRLAAQGWDLVRRPTGGRAILHTDELTYAVTGPVDEPRLEGSILESYKRLATGLLQGLQILAVPAESHHPPVENSARDPDRTKPICFEVPGSYEITVNGKKLIGSAQARKKFGVLQHGTIPLTGDLKRITQVLRYPDQAARDQAGARLLKRATTVEASLHRVVDWDTAAEAIRTAFQETLNIVLEPGDLTRAERAKADELVAQKFGNLAWNGRI